MKKFISLMNPYSFYYIWNSKFKFYLEDLIKDITKIDDSLELTQTFNNTTKYLKSYIFLESNNYLIYLDFNFDDNILAVYNFLKITSDKRVLLIVFNSFNGFNNSDNGIYQIYQNKDNTPILKLFLSKNFKEQSKTEFKDILEYLYNLDNQFYSSYLREENFKNK